ncbi:hypothetical protein [Massilia sp. 9I]|uniref:hypothetical protein n=1 Tax=Massilia sp. 9I TaxID=2653152 RepID=UPI0012F24317|nr:hypothetical protein [Massilia sp. 9I]VXB60563.1 membrane hypothetical protein [Massilia sp. 9I]
MRIATIRTAFKAIAIYVALSAVFALLWLAFAYPDLPTSPTQWAAVFLLALPAQLLFEWLASRFWNTRLTKIVDERTAGQRLSLLRIGYGLVVTVAGLGLVFAVGYVLKTLFG